MELNERYHERQVMVEEQLKAHGIEDGELIDAFLKIPRHLFVDDVNRARAYEDRPLPLGTAKGEALQTISQPYIVALMLQKVLKGKERGSFLEIGSGCGYLLALASKLYKRVVGVERIESLVMRSKNVLNQIGVENVDLLFGDVSQIDELIPNEKFDACIISCSMNHVIPALFEHLQYGGVLVAPVGNRESQQLIVYNKNEDGTIRRAGSHGEVRFVPFVPSVEHEKK